MNQRPLLEEFLVYTANIKSPENFIHAAFYFMIGASLQRRVWLNSYKAPIFPNVYVGLCGGPGVGKGLIIKPVIELLRYHKFQPNRNPAESHINKLLSEASKNGTTPETIQLLQQAKEAMDQIKETTKSKNALEDKLLFPIGADATTFESMVQEHGSAIRVYHTSPCPMAPSGSYTHHSIIFTLQEASSLFEKNSKRIVDYLLHAYDCSDYTYKTKTQGIDIIKRSSLSLLFGTTPDFIRNAFTDQLLGEGFSSRTMFVYGKEARFEDWRIADSTLEQSAIENTILNRLKELSKMFGQCSMSEEAIEFMDAYFKGDDCPYKKEMKKMDEKLKHYYARKNLHVQKIAMCMHFADSNDFEIPLWCFKKAMEFLSSIEETMIFCLNTKSANPTGDLSRRIYKHIRENSVASYSELVLKFSDDGDMKTIEEALSILMIGDKIKQEGMYYKIKIS